MYFNTDQFTNSFDISNYICEDYYNSYFIHLLSNLNYKHFVIHTCEGRPDLISKEIYNNPMYASILILLNPYSSFKITETINYIELSEIERLLLGLQVEKETLGMNNEV